MLSPGRSTLPVFVFEDQLPEDPSSPAPTPSPSSAVSRLRCADWLLRDTPYSEGVAEHKRGETCRDCVRFHGDESSELQVSVHGAQHQDRLLRNPQAADRSLLVRLCSLPPPLRHMVSPVQTTCRHATSHASASSLTSNSPPSCWLWESKANAAGRRTAGLGVCFFLTV